jgi:two-component sensor histidine kinase
MWGRVVVTVAVLAAACAVQLPIANNVPGEPFLLFLLVVIATTLAFGAGVGIGAVGLSTLLSVPFFEPVGTITLTHAADLIKIELYAVLAGICVVAVATFANALVAAGDKNKDLERLDVNKSLLLRELAHGVANNFATVAALMSTKSSSVGDAKAKMALEEAIEQVRVMARVHRRLRANSQDASLDSRAFINELCGDLKGVARGRSIAIECKADSRPLCMDEAVTLGLIVNELVTNAIKHAFPDGRSGRIRIGFEALDHHKLRLTVQDDGVGLGDSRPQIEGGGEGHELLRGLANMLQGTLDIESRASGSSFRLTIPHTDPPQQSAAITLH